MRKSLFFLVFLVAVQSLAGLVGTWEGIVCQTYNDNRSHGTYNYKFMENGQAEMFIQYYDDSECAKAKVSAELQSKGNYTVTEQPLDDEDGEYHLRLFYNHSNRIKILKIVIKGEQMSMFDQNGDSLGIYRRLSK